MLNSAPINNTLSLRSAPSHTLLPHTTSSLIRTSVTRSPKHQPLNCKPRTPKPKDYARRMVVWLYDVYDGDMMWAQQYKLALRKWANQCKLALRRQVLHNGGINIWYVNIKYICLHRYMYNIYIYIYIYVCIYIYIIHTDHVYRATGAHSRTKASWPSETCASRD